MDDHEWLIECQARTIAGYSSKRARQEALQWREDDGTDTTALKAAIMRIWRERQGADKSRS